MNSVKLANPINLNGGETISEIDFRPPTAKDIRINQRLIGDMGRVVDATYALMQTLGTIKDNDDIVLDQNIIDQMSYEDFNACQMVVEDFLTSSRRKK